MAQSTEDYLDSLLRQAMGIPEPEPEVIPETENEVFSESVLDIDLEPDQGIVEPELDAISEQINTDIPIEPVDDLSDSLLNADNLMVDGMELTSGIEDSIANDDVLISEDLLRPNSDDDSLEDIVIENMPIEDDVDVDIPIEEISAEESPVEEPLIEEVAPLISIDDLDPADANKAMDPDMIAALFASANAGDVADSTTEEPSIEETAIDEAPIEEIPVEEATPSISIDDLDPADANKALDPDMIAALFASANADDVAPDDATVEESSVEETQVEENIVEEPVLEDNSNDEPKTEDALDLFEDEEITNLLDSLDSLGDSPELEIDDAASIDVNSDDFSNLDLGSMLDDVTSASVEETSESDLDDFSASDLNDLLNSIDGDSDISDIGDMLSKDENSELLDPVQDIFASDSSESLFDINNVLDEEEASDKDKKKKKEKKKKDKKEKKGLFGKKNKSTNEEKTPIPDDFGEEIAINPESWDIPDKSESATEEAKKGFFARLFEKLFEEVDEDETVEGKLIEESAIDVAVEGAEVNEQLLKEGEEDNSKKKKGKKDKKDKKKKGKDGEEGEEGEESPKKKKKKEKKAKEESEPEAPTKKLPIKKVILIFVLCFSIGGILIFAATYIPYSSDMNNAKKYYAAGDYEKTYELLSGHDLSEKNQEIYNRTFTLLKIKRFYSSYLNYMKLGFKIEALNALVQGVQAMDENAEKAYSMGIGDRFMSVAADISTALENTFGVSIEQAREWYNLEGTEDYTRSLYEFLYNKQSRDENGNLVFVPEDSSNEVLEAEEDDL